jgi:protein O-mannosyl-transferase
VKSTETPLRFRLQVLGTLILCILAYWASLSGGFLFDDFFNLVNNASLRAIGTPTQDWFAAAFSSGTGPLRRPISMLSFALNISAFGMNPWAFKAVNLAIHLGNGILVYALGVRLVDRLVVNDGMGTGTNPRILAAIAAAIWLLHPLNVSGVIYIVQRMNALATLFTLAGLLVYAEARARMLRGEPALLRALSGLIAFGILASLSKENGALIVAFAWVIELMCFRFEVAASSQRRVLKGFFWLALGVPLALFATYLATHPDWFEHAYAGREFSAVQRLLTEPRIICDYLLWIFVPNPGWMGMYHDDIATSTGLFAPLSTILSIVFLIALCGFAWVWRQRAPAFAFAVAWFLVGHSMESTILPLELVFEHRNYLPMSGLILGMVCLAVPWLQKSVSTRAGIVASLAVVAICAGVTSIRAANWGDPLGLALSAAANHPNSARSQYEAGRALVIAGAREGDRENAELRAMPYYARAADLDKDQIHAATELVLLKARAGTIQASEIADLADRISRVRYISNLNPFLDMLVTASNQKLSLKPEDIAKLVDSALRNKRVPKNVRARIKNNYGAYLFNIVNDQGRAIRLVEEAAAEDPANPYYEISLAQIAGAMQQHDKAQEHLINAQRLDKTKAYARDIATMRAELQNH